jgi:hypothetical protein
VVVVLCSLAHSQPRRLGCGGVFLPFANIEKAPRASPELLNGDSYAHTHTLSVVRANKHPANVFCSLKTSQWRGAAGGMRTSNGRQFARLDNEPNLIDRGARSYSTGPREFIDENRGGSVGCGPGENKNGHNRPARGAPHNSQNEPNVRRETGKE